jgi:DnaJ family protein A protein 2
LDGRDIVIKTKPGQIIDCETTDEETGKTLPYVTTVKDEGMPSQGNPFVRGNLYIAFRVVFPKTLPADIIQQLRQILPDADIEENYDPTVVEEHYTEFANLRHYGQGGAAVVNANDDSDDEDQQGVQCQQS